ncbi:MAG: TetR/AcrR family transcriptional regulator [Solirubrobacterales bacterium]
MSTEPPAQPAKRKRLTAAARRATILAAAAAVFAERGYNGASIEEIARRSGITPPVLYDHFASKQDLFRALLEAHFADLREIWREHLAGDAPLGERVARSFDAWFAYVGEHPFAGRLLFRETTGDPEVAAMHAAVAAASRAAVMPLAEAQPGALELAGGAGAEASEMLWEILRGVLQNLAIWWYEHPEVPRERVVAAAMNALWIGFERVQRGEAWRPPG